MTTTQEPASASATTATPASAFSAGSILTAPASAPTQAAARVGPTQGAAQTAPDPAAAQQTPAATGKWWESVSDADLKGYAETKGWKSPEDLLSGYRNLEKLVGVEKIPMPKNEADAEGWDRVWKALGRPEKADDYKLPVPEGMDGAYAKAASEQFHKLGITAKQAQALAEWNNAQVQAAQKAQTEQSQARFESELSALKSEWGGAWDENRQLAAQAARQFNVDPDKLQAGLGVKDALSFLAQVGRGLTEHSFEGGKGTGFGMTPDAAKSRLDSRLREVRAEGTQAVHKFLLSDEYADLNRKIAGDTPYKGGLVRGL
jgi:hypothetical protein